VIDGIHLTGYMVKDASRAIAFYRDVLGLEPTLVYPDNRGAEYEFADGTTFGLWGGLGDVFPFQPSNGALFGTSDIESAVKSVRDRGVEIFKEIDTPFCKMAMLADTEGNTITLHQRK
jgi:predicted enzyme related to lactoylglutathione lyase